MKQRRSQIYRRDAYEIPGETYVVLGESPRESSSHEPLREDTNDHGRENGLKKPG
jgi:hypothetical protein